MKTSSLLTLAVAMTLSCTGTDVGNPIVDLDFALYDSSASSTSARSHQALAASGLIVDKAWVVIERIRLRHAANCEGGAQDEFVGPFAIDMLAPGPAPALAGLEVTASSYCRVEFRWDALRSDELPGAPADLEGASLLLAGVRDDGTRFLLRSERGDELRMDARNNAFTIDDLTGALFVTFDVQELFDSIDIDDAEVAGDGVIHIDGSSNEELLTTFDSNLTGAAKLFDDNDGDGELDPEERDDTDVLAE